MKRDAARALDIALALGLLAIAFIIIARAVNEAEPLVASALGLLRDA